MKCVEMAAAPPFADLFARQDPFAWLQDRSADMFRDLPERSTFRFEYQGEAYFAKLHHGVGVRELVKNLLVARLPVFDARAERDAAAALREAGVPTLEPVAWGQGPGGPLGRRSFIITREIEHTATLDELLRSGLSATARRRHLRAVAQLVRRMHDAGVNHRDLYLVHFLVDAGGALHLIDLHRAQRRKQVPRRWRVKDLAALLFSAQAAGALGARDRLRFIAAYRDRPLRQLLGSEAGFWRAVLARARRMHTRGTRG